MTMRYQNGINNLKVWIQAILFILDDCCLFLLKSK